MFLPLHSGRYLFLLSALLLLVTGSLLVQSLGPTPYQVHPVTFVSGTQRLSGSLYMPQSLKQPAPAIILVHGVIVNKEFMAAMADTLARHGMIALAFDLGGYGESDARAESEEANVADTLAALAFLKQEPLVDATRIGLMGHSMGGTAVILAALAEPKIRTVASFGMSHLIQPYQPCHMFWSAGLYDNLHPPDEMRAAFQKGSPSAENPLGCRHHLFLSPTANHQTEMRDYQTLKRVMEWLQVEFSLPEPIKIVSPWHDLGLILSGSGLFLMLTVLFSPLSTKRGLAIGWLGLSGGLMGLSAMNVLPSLPTSVMVIFLLGVSWVTTFWTAERASSFWLCLQSIALMWLSYEIINLLNLVGEYAKNPAYLLGMPLYLLQSGLNALLAPFITLRPHLFTTYTTTLIPAWSLLGLLLLECCRPGWLLQVLVPLTQRIVSFSQAEFHFHLPQSEKSPWWKMLLLLGLCGFLAVMLWQRFNSGFLTPEALYRVSKQGLFHILPTFVLALAALRWLLRGPEKPGRSSREGE